MTRYTNVALKKRPYVEAGFNYREEPEMPEASTSNTAPQNTAEAGSSTLEQTVAPKKKRKRGKSRKPSTITDGGAEGTETTAAAEDRGGGAVQPSDGTVGNSPVRSKTTNTKADKGKKKLKEKSRDARKFASERRRLQRQDERHINTTCYACREQGHPARDCPKALATIDSNDTKGKQLGRQAVGICYRCGSRKHNLSRCSLPVDPDNPLPFSSCFVCSGKGHLASSCPQNQSRGVYPNGGCCKLCRETTHLAKDCNLRKPEASSTTLFLGTGREAGADEDDFHTFKRRNAEVVNEEKASERLKRQADVKVGAHSGVVKSFGQVAQKPKKVISF